MANMTPEQMTSLRADVRQRIEAWLPIHHRDPTYIDDMTTDVLDAVGTHYGTPDLALFSHSLRQ